MNEPTKSIWRREVPLPNFFLIRWPRQFLRWLFSRRGLRALLIALAWAATLIALFYGEENWRGSRAWNRYRREAEARGEQLDFQALIPKPVPAADNFAATPAIEAWFTNRNADWDDPYFRAAKVVGDSGSRTNRGRRHFTDLAAWQQAFDYAATHTNYAAISTVPEFTTDELDRESRAQAAPAVLNGLKPDDALFAELRAASRRPHSVYPVVYTLDDPWGILLPHLAKIKGTCQRLQLKASAELALGRSDDAFQDVQLMLSMADSLKGEPILISYLVRMACVQLAVQPIWEGLAAHTWSESQVRELERCLQQYDFAPEFNGSLAGERGAAVLTADLLARGKYYLRNLSMSGMNQRPDPLAEIAARLAPRGWYHLEKLNYCRFQHSMVEGALDTERKTISPAAVELNRRKLEREFGSETLLESIAVTHEFVSALLLPALANVPPRIAAAQTGTDEAALACALERYRMANGAFPETLDALAPRFIPTLPHDVIGGGPYHYRRTDRGQFILYSVGWNEKDDGGRPGQSLADQKDGDWIWQYPE